MRMRLLTDSCCDLPRRVLEDAGVGILEYPYILSDGERTDDMWRSSTPDEFYALIRAGEFPKTAQIPIPVIREAFETAAREGLPTTFLSFSSELSGTFSTILLLAEAVRADHPGFELHVVDTCLASIAQGELVLEAIEKRDAGASAAELAEWATEARNFIHGYFTLDGLEHLSRGGRLPEIAATATSKLDVKPIITFSLSGKLAIDGATRGRRKSLKALADSVIDHGGDGGRMTIASADAEEDADRLEALVRESFPDAEIVRTSIGPVIGSHVGPGMVAVAFVGEDRRTAGIVADVAAATSAAVDKAKGVAESASTTARDAVGKARDAASSAGSSARDAADAARGAAGAARDALKNRFGRG